MELRIFAHINEYGPSAWSMLPALIAMGKRVTLWAPSGTQLRQAHEAETSPYSPKDVLELIESGAVRVAGRRGWLLDRNGRSGSGGGNGYSGAVWLPAFDDQISKWAREQDGQADATVTILGEEVGLERASADIARRNEKYKRAGKLLRTGNIPRGTAERMSRLSGSGEKLQEARIRAILRDAYNHSDAQVRTGSNVGVEFADKADAQASIEFASLGDRPEMPTPVKGRPLTLDMYRRVFDLLDDLAGDVSVKSMIKLAGHAGRRQEIADLLSAGASAPEDLLKRIEAGTRKPRGATEYLGDNTVERASAAVGLTATPLGIISGLIGYRMLKGTDSRLTRRDALKAFAGLAVSASPVGYIAARELGVLPMDNDYTGPIVPFLLARNTTAPTRRDVDEVVATLRELVEGSLPR